MALVQTEAEEREAAIWEFGWIIGRGEAYRGMLPMEIMAILAGLPVSEDRTRVILTGFETREIIGLCFEVREIFAKLRVPDSVFAHVPPAWTTRAA